MYNECIAWRRDKTHTYMKKKSHRCCHPFLNMSSCRCACLSPFLNEVVHTFSISQLIIFNCSLVDRTSEYSLKINVYLFSSFLQFISISRQLHWIRHDSLLYSLEQTVHDNDLLYSSTNSIIWFSFVQHL